MATWIIKMDSGMLFMHNRIKQKKRSIVWKVMSKDVQNICCIAMRSGADQKIGGLYSTQNVKSYQKIRNTSPGFKQKLK